MFASLAGAAAAAIALPAPLAAAENERRVLSFFHIHTGHHLTVAYRDRGAYLADGLAALDTFLRDFRTGDEHPIDAALFDILHDLRVATGGGAPFQVISGYRSPQSTALLHDHSSGVAAGSLHMQGRAIDVRLADVSSAHMNDAALALQRGGVGYYSASDFVHLDTGRVRHW